VEAEPELARAVVALAALDGGAPGTFRPVVDVLLHFDRYFHAADFRSYSDTQARAAAAWRAGLFPAMSIRNVAGCGRFSSERTIRQYAEEIWNTSSVTP
jgi:starch phosphorylase